MYLAADDLVELLFDHLLSLSLHSNARWPRAGVRLTHRSFTVHRGTRIGRYNTLQITIVIQGFTQQGEYT